VYQPATIPAKTYSGLTETDVPTVAITAWFIASKRFEDEDPEAAKRLRAAVKAEVTRRRGK